MKLFLDVVKNIYTKNNIFYVFILLELSLVLDEIFKVLRLSFIAWRISFKVSTE
jgi:hypothetical protein